MASPRFNFQAPWKCPLVNATKILLRMLSALALFFAQHPSAGQTSAPSPVSAGTATPAPSASAAGDIRTEAGLPFTREEKVQLAARVLAPPTVAQKAMPQRRKVISVTVTADNETFT